MSRVLVFLILLLSYDVVAASPADKKINQNVISEFYRLKRNAIRNSDVKFVSEFLLTNKYKEKYALKICQDSEFTEMQCMSSWDIRAKIFAEESAQIKDNAVFDVLAKFYKVPPSLIFIDLTRKN